MITNKDFEIIREEIKKLKKRKPKIMIQIPEGLKSEATKLIDTLSEFCEPILELDPCYGACDIRCEEAKIMKCDAILHIGHIKFYRDIDCDIPIIYYPLNIDVEIPEEELEKIPFKRVGLISTVQHISSLEKIKNALENKNKKVIIGGEILGCWTANVKRIERNVDCFLLVSSGRFHALGIKTEKPVYIFDPERGIVEEIDKSEEISRLKVLYARLDKLKNSKKIGLIVSRKPGQFYNDWKKIKEKLENMGKKVYVLMMDYITNDKLMGLDVDVLINTACPRLFDDHLDKPLINLEDLLKFISSK
ncbi:MAG: diphthamide biosynthesis enzyme Dph2 [Candidatus Aenigmarchaeota archaeon]|nr:diphthamide biosynthesis enzyme Dph2 [Candidatus Aenigmarchaeota archaeon]